MKSVLISGLLLSIIGLTGCSKKDTVKPGENSVTAFITENALTTSTRTSGPWELGIVFSAAVAGKLTEVGSKMPEPGSYRVIVWDFDTKQILRQKTIEQTSPDKLTLNGIDALPLTANKKYVISINSQSDGANKKYAIAAKTANAEFMPFTKGSILVYYSCYQNTATPVFPTVVTNVKNELYGYPEFTFVPD